MDDGETGGGGRVGGREESKAGQAKAVEGYLIASARISSRLPAPNP